MHHMALHSISQVWLVQQAEVAELNRRAQHAEQESSAARAEAAAVRQAAAQQQAERAVAQYSQATRMAGLPFQDAQSTREYDPLPALGFSRYLRQPHTAVVCKRFKEKTSAVG